MANFGTLQTRILNNLIDAKASVQAAVPDLINSAILEATMDKNWKCMQSTIAVTTTAGQHAIGSFSTTFKEVDDSRDPYWISQSGDATFLEIRPSKSDALRTWSDTDPTDKGSPGALVLDGTTPDGNTSALVYPFPDGLSDWTSAPVGEYRIVIPAWVNLAPLSVVGDTNWFTVKGELWLEHYATALGFMRDWAEDKATAWFTLAAGYYKKLKRWDADAVLATTETLTPRSDVNARTNQMRRDSSGGAIRGWKFSS